MRKNVLVTLTSGAFSFASGQRSAGTQAAPVINEHQVQDHSYIDTRGCKEDERERKKNEKHPPSLLRLT